MLLTTAILKLERINISLVNDILKLEKPILKLSELTDGIILMEVLSLLDSNYFSVQLISPNAEGWNSKYDNLKKVLKCIGDYCFDVNQRAFEKQGIDIMTIAKDDDKQGLVNLLLKIWGMFLFKKEQIFLDYLIERNEDDKNFLVDWIRKFFPFKEEEEENFILLNPEHHTKEFYKNDTKIKQILQRIDEVEEENINLKENMRAFEESLNSCKKKCEEIEKENILKAEEINSLIEKARNLEAANMKLSQTKQNDSEILMIQSTNRILSEKISNMEITHAAEINELKEENKGLRVQLSKNTLNSKNYELYKNKLDDYDRMFYSFQTASSENENSLKKIKDLENEIQTKEKLFTKSRETVTNLRAEKVNITLDLNQKSSEIQSLKKEIGDLNTQISKKEAKINKLENDLEKYQSADHRGGIRCKKSSATWQANFTPYNWSQGVLTSTNDFGFNYGERSSLDTENDKMNRQDELLNSEKDDEIENLKKENNILMSNCKLMQKEIECLRSDISRLQKYSNYNNIVDEGENLKTENRKHRETIKNLKAELHKVKMDIEDFKEESHQLEMLKEQLIKKEEEISKQRSQLSKANNLIQKLNEKQNKQQVSDAGRINTLESLKNNTIDKLKEEKEKLEKECTYLKNFQEKERKFREEEIKFLISALYELRVHYEELRANSHNVRFNHKSNDSSNSKIFNNSSAHQLKRKIETEK